MEQKGRDEKASSLEDLLSGTAHLQHVTLYSHVLKQADVPKTDLAKGGQWTLCGNP